jgi:hypothetical protein
MARAQFRDTVMLRGPAGLVAVPPGMTASAALFDVGTSNPISDVIYAGESGAGTLPNPFATGDNGLVNFWTTGERELDIVASCPGFINTRTTVATDAPGQGAADVPLRTYIQHIMSQLDPGGPPAP